MNKNCVPSFIVSGYCNKYDGYSVIHENVCLKFGPRSLPPNKSDLIKETHDILLIHKSYTLHPNSLEKAQGLNQRSFPKHFNI